MICTDSIIRKNNWHMKQKENEKNNLNEMGVAIGVDSEVIEKVRSGEITHIIVTAACGRWRLRWCQC